MFDELQVLVDKHKIYLGCDDGWNGILLDFMKVFDELHEEGKKVGVDLYVIQIKEKFGGLRIYWSYDYSNELVDKKHTDEESKEEKFLAKAIPILEAKEREADDLSYKTCERCGSTDDIFINRNFNWMKSLCKECDQKRIDKEK